MTSIELGALASVERMSALRRYRQINIREGRDATARAAGATARNRPR